MEAIRRWWQAYWPAVAVIAMIAVVVVLCLMASSSSGAATGARLPRFAGGRVLLRHGLIAGAEVTEGALYVAIEQARSGKDTLAAVNPADGRVLARKALGAAFDGARRFDGSLWVVTTGVTRRSDSSQLWQLNPDTLAVRRRRELPGSHDARSVVQPFAVAGGRLWLAYDGRLTEVDPRTGTLAPERRIAKAREVGIVAGPGGRTLIVSAGDGSGRGWLQERSAISGAFEKTSRNYEGVTMPQLGGTYRGRLWLTESTGMMGYMQAVSLRTLRPLRTPAVPRYATNGIRTLIADGMLFVTQTAGGPTRNYCGDPVTGAARVTLPVAGWVGGGVSVLGDAIVYVGPATHGAASGPLEIAAIPAACR